MMLAGPLALPRHACMALSLTYLAFHVDCTQGLEKPG